MNSQGVFGSRICLEFFLKPVYPTTLSRKSFKFMVLRLLEDTFVSQKMTFVHFCWYPQGRWKLVISSEQRFRKIYFPLAERGKDYGTDKMSKIKLGTILVTGFDKFHHLCSLCIFGFCFILPKFRFKHAEL